MTCSECADDKIVPNQYFEDLKVDNITIDKEVVERAKQNNADAIHAIGYEYARLEKREKAIEWFGISAAIKFTESQLELGHLFAKANDDSMKYTLEWYLLARKNGAKSASLYVATTMFEKSRYKGALQYFQEAADMGDAYAQFRLALGYYSYWGLSRFTIDSDTHGYIYTCFSVNKNFALEWFLKSAKQGYSEAAYYVGRIHENGEGVPIDKYHALEWYHKSSQGGYKPAEKCIDLLRKQGYFYVPKDKELASCESSN